MRNLKITIAYDGKDLHGWQVQKNAITVQELFQQSLYNIIGDKPDIKGCSRTDTGVHANMYCISVKTEHKIPCVRLKAALNRYLPKSIAVLDVAQVDDDFHARYSCLGKEYIYKIWNSDTRNPFLDGYALFYRYNLNESLLNEAAQSFVGSHDFTSFCTVDKREKGDFTRCVEHFSITRDDRLVTMSVQADGFLYNMVRIMVGTLLKISQGKLDYNSIEQIIEQKDRKAAGPTAPPCGLYLNRVIY